MTNMQAELNVLALIRTELNVNLRLIVLGDPDSKPRQTNYFEKLSAAPKI
jgi:hypothetical protein